MTDKDSKAEVKPCEAVERITNDEKVEVNQVVNKKLTAMSKETKARKKKKLEKPPKDEHTTSATTMTDNQMFMLLGIIGVIIAGVSLYYQRKTATKDVKKEKKKEEKPKEHIPHDVKDDLPEDDALIKW